MAGEWATVDGERVLAGGNGGGGGGGGGGSGGGAAAAGAAAAAPTAARGRRATEGGVAGGGAPQSPGVVAWDGSLPPPGTGGPGGGVGGPGGGAALAATFRRFLYYQVGVDGGAVGEREEDGSGGSGSGGGGGGGGGAAGAGGDGGSGSLEEALAAAGKRRAVYNFVQVPLKLERLLALGVLVCADEFLSVFTLLPLRVVAAVSSAVAAAGRWLARRLRSLRATHHRGWAPVPTPPPASAAARRRAAAARTRRVVGAAVDIVHLSLLVATAATLFAIDISRVYHSIRGQSVIKLYVVFNVMEIFDRLCCSFGVDVLDSLGWTAASAVSFHLAEAPPPPPRWRRARPCPRRHPMASAPR